MISVLYNIILITNFKLIEMCIKSSLSEGLGEALHAARHTQRCSNGSEHRDNHIKDCFPLFVFHTF